MTKDTTSAVWTWGPLEGLAADLRAALRQIRRRPAFALACTGVLAIGLAATTLVFSVLYQAVLKPPPYPHPEQLVVLHNRIDSFGMPRASSSGLDLMKLASRPDVFSSIGGYFFLDLARTGIDRPVKVNAIAVTPGVFEALKTNPILGRTFTARDEQLAITRPVVISESYWRAQFASDPGVLNRTLRLDDDLYSIVGVMPSSFQFPNDVTQMWVLPSKPLEATPAPPEKRMYYIRTIARLAPGLTFDQATARIADVSRQFAQADPQSYPMARLGWQFVVVPMNRDDDGSLRQRLWILFAAVGCLLLIVCTNVAGLLLARSNERQFDLTLRLALGASRLRVMRLVMVEVGLLAIAGGSIGMALAWAAIAVVERIPGIGAVKMETPVAWFALGLALLAGLASGLYPAWASTKAPAAEALKSGGHQRTASQASGRRQQALIVAQVGLATTLLVSGGLLVRSMARLVETSAGFDPRNLLTLQIDTPPARRPVPEDRARFSTSVLDAIAAIPGVEEVSDGGNLPFGYGDSVTPFQVESESTPAPGVVAIFSSVRPNYFHTMRIPILEGRAFTNQDRIGSEPVIMIDETLARKYFGEVSPVGRRLRMRGRSFLIVGVAASVKTVSLDQDNRSEIYMPSLQLASTSMTIVVRSTLPPSSLADAIARALASIDKNQPIHEVASMETVMRRSFRARLTIVWLLGGFAAAGLLLAAVGLYAMLAYVTGQRRRELSIRKALGATVGSVAMLVGKQGAALVTLGLVLGALGAVAAERWLVSQLYATSFADAFTWISVSGVILVTGALAIAIPAWRAARANPADALRAE